MIKMLGQILRSCRSDRFWVIKVEELERFQPGERIYDTWRYARMNRDKKLYIINFKTIEELRQAVFNTVTCVYGDSGVLSSCKSNLLYQKSDEEILMLLDLGKLPN